MKGFNDKIEEVLRKLNRNDLNIIAKKLGVKKYNRGAKELLVNTILSTYSAGQIKKALSISAWDRYQNHIYGVASLLGLILTLLFYFYPSPSPPNDPKPNPSTAFPDKQTSVSSSYKSKRVTVLEFNNQSTDENLSWLGPILSTSILEKLRHFPEVETYASESFGNNLQDILNKKPDVKILVGNYIVENKFINISTRLIDGVSGKDDQTAQFRIEIEKLYELRDQLSDLILKALSIKANLLGHPEEQILTPQNLLALEYLGKYKIAIKQKDLKRAGNYLATASFYGLETEKYNYYYGVLLEQQGKFNLALERFSQVTQFKTRDDIIRWTQKVETDAGKASLIIYKNLLFIISRDILLCLNRQNGTVLWEFRYSDLRAICVLNDTVYVGSEDGKVVGFSPHDGHKISEINLNDPIFSLTIAENKLLFVTGDHGGVTVTNQSVGLIDVDKTQILWTRKIIGSTSAKPIVNEGFIYLATSMGKIYALNVVTGSYEWEVDANKELYFEFYKDRKSGLNLFLRDTSLTKVNSELIVGGYGSSIYKVDANTGKLISSLSVEGGAWTDIFYSDGKLNFGSSGNTLTQVNSQNGTIIWQRYLGKDKEWDEFKSSPLYNREMIPSVGQSESYYVQESDEILTPIVTADRIYASYKDIIYLLNPTTGEVNWKYRLPVDKVISMETYEGALYVVARTDVGVTSYSFEIPKEYKDTYLKELSHVELGKIYYNQGRFDLAESNFKATVEKDDSFYVGYKYLAALAQLQKKNEDAVTFWQKYLSYVGPDAKESEFAEKALQALTKYRFKKLAGPNWPCTEKFNSKIEFMETDNFLAQYEDGKTVGLFPTGNRLFFPTIVKDGLVLIFQDSSSIEIAFYDPINKVFKWTKDIEGGRATRPVIHNNHLIIGLYDEVSFSLNEEEQFVKSSGSERKLYALDKDTGNIVWSATYTSLTGINSPPLLAHNKLILSSRPISVDDKAVYVGNGSNSTQRDEIMVVNPENGELIWKFQTDWSRSLANVQKRDIVREELLTLDPPSGLSEDNLDSTLATLTNRINLFELVKVGELDYEVGAGKNESYALNLETGEVLWRISFGDNVVAFPSASENGVFFKLISESSESLVALEKGTGKETWKYVVDNLPIKQQKSSSGLSFNWTDEWVFFPKIHIDIHITPPFQQTSIAPLINKTVVYSGFRDGKLISLDMTNHQILWEYKIPASITSSPVECRGKIVVKGSDDYSYYFEPN